MLRSAAIALVLGVSAARAFSFYTSTPEQCGQLTVTWDGGTEPFHLLIVPTTTVDAGRIVNVSIPTGLTQPYSYTFDLPEPTGLEMLMTMWDATGWGSGGTTDTLTVGSSSNTSCLSDNLHYDFFFSIDPQTDPSQCSSMAISWDDNVTYPLHLYGLIPSGSAFDIPVSQSNSDVDINWTVDIRAGTDFLLVMADSGTYQTGGSTNLLTVGSGGDSCINSTSPASATPSSSSTSSATSSTTSGSSSTASSSTASSSTASSSIASSSTARSSAAGSSTSSSAGSVAGVGGGSAGGTSGSDSSGSSSGSSGSSKIGPIVGGVVGGVAFLALLGLFAFCCRRRRTRKEAQKEGDPLLKSYGVAGEKGNRRSGPVDLLEEGGGGAGLGATRHDSGETHMEGQTGGYEVTPFRGGYPAPGSPRQDMAAVGGVGKADDARTPVRDTATPLRASLDSNPEETTNLSSGGGTGGAGGTGGTPAWTTAPSAWAASDMATVGHGPPGDEVGAAAPARSNSIRKPASASTLREREAELARPLPQPPAPRFVQHEDSGEIVDLPPRYDQLRTRNPDQ